MLSKFFVLIALITKYDTITSLTLVRSFLKILLHSVTNRESFTNFKTVITVWQKVITKRAGITKCGNY